MQNNRWANFNSLWRIVRMGIRRFYLISILFSWFIWITGSLFWHRHDYAVVLIAIGGLGPLIALLDALFRTYDRASRKSYLRRLISASGVPAAVWLVALLLPVMLVLLVIFYESLTKPESAGIFPTLLDSLAPAGGLFFVFHIFFGPLPEEMAWRGYAFHELSGKSICQAQLIVASLWALWHVPLFFIQGSYQAGLGLFTTGFWLFFINIFASSFIAGWLYLKSRCSIVIAFVFHYLVNVTGELFNLSDSGEIAKHMLLAVSGIIFFLLSARKDKQRRRPDCHTTPI